MSKADLTKFVNKFINDGQEKFYNFLISHSLNLLADLSSTHDPSLELLEYHDIFVKMYRKEGELIYLELAKQFRRAAHKIYRIMLKKKITVKSLKFLNTV